MAPNFPLWRELAAGAGVRDVDYIDQMQRGFPIVGQVQPSGIWPAKEVRPAITLDELDARAWEIQLGVAKKISSRQTSTTDSHLWDITTEEARKGYCTGPYTAAELSRHLGTEAWVPTPRFPVVQGTKVRAVDSATESLINPATGMSEQLQISSTDQAVALLREVEKGLEGRPVGAWVLDEAAE